MAKRKQILKQMFDVRPVKEDGSLDLEKIEGRGRIVRVERKKPARKGIFFKKMSDVRSPREIFSLGLSSRKKEKSRKEKVSEEISDKPRKSNAIQLGRIVPDDFVSISKIPTREVFSDRKEKIFYPPKTDFDPDFDYFFEQRITEEESPELILSEEEIIKSTNDTLKLLESKKKKRGKKVSDQNFEFPNIFSLGAPVGKRFSHAYALTAAILIFSMTIPCFSYIQRGFETKKFLLNSSESALGKFAKAKDNLVSGNFEKASLNFEDSREILEAANGEVSKIGGDFSEILRFVPGISKVATASYILSAGENIASAGKAMTDSVKSLIGLENPLSGEGNISLTELFLNLRGGISETSQNMEKARESLNKANLDDLPPEIRPKFLELKEKLPSVVSSLKSFSDDSNIILDVLGCNGPRKFLFLFQNNQEMRATGGFIGSYGILDISNGKIKKLFVDDIYNPDGQLTARVIPPEPIQKMSAVWTMHDANWFPDFPTSAEKVAWFYEKTGGPTVDGVVAMTPTVIEKMLSVTGPIEMPEYDTTVNEENFVEKTEYEVETDYDKEENRPKKFIADLTPKILDEFSNTKNPKDMLRALQIFSSALKERQILIYSKNYNIQKMVSAQGWSGEILNTSKDYLSVVNTNINGYKTDGVIDETIEHKSEIQNDGSVIDTVSVTRHHNGGNEKYDWWNKVNADFMRVYVPEGSKLLEASGQTREFVSPPLDYQNLGFKKDPQVQANEDSTRIDDATGTKIYTENRKTVFANWVYVSPGESVTITYKYILPFELSFDSLHHPADTFSVLYQKQSGSKGSLLSSEIKLPENMRSIWRWPENIDLEDNSLIIKASLDTDKFVGLAIEKN
ncbi:MAG: DUF4012 domain-containing protein [Patescibacteria group bacterium]|nr:DUF4012 domain-containing protein [Patescibacteria group bacterium]